MTASPLFRSAKTAAAPVAAGAAWDLLPVSMGPGGGGGGGGGGGPPPEGAAGAAPAPPAGAL